MTYRRVILKRLKHFYDGVGAHESASLLLDPIDIIGKPGNTKYVAAINQLVREGLILGIVPEGGNRPVFSLNTAKIDEVVKELSWWRSPTFVFIVSTFLGVAGFAWAVMRFFLEK